ncbi:MAG: hypothetical protein HKN87_23120 [Saprospiraceae bacterium]|nr:hypothetical protein [Saprospiraceae bacterium]
MIEEIKGLDSKEYIHLKDAIALITVLIAGADGEIDTKEKDWAKKITDIRSYTLPDGLKKFYEDVGISFQDRLDHYIELYKGDIEGRNKAISDRLAELNDILPKIRNRELAIALYESLLSFAKHVARASGGFLKWGGISSKEEKLMNLDMIDPLEEQ